MFIVTFVTYLFPTDGTSYVMTLAICTARAAECMAYPVKYSHVDSQQVYLSYSKTFSRIDIMN